MNLTHLQLICFSISFPSGAARVRAAATAVLLLTSVPSAEVVGVGDNALMLNITSLLTLNGLIQHQHSVLRHESHHSVRIVEALDAEVLLVCCPVPGKTRMTTKTVAVA